MRRRVTGKPAQPGDASLGTDSIAWSDSNLCSRRGEPGLYHRAGRHQVTNGRQITDGLVRSTKKQKGAELALAAHPLFIAPYGRATSRTSGERRATRGEATGV